jgi:hypothetical protein
MRGNDELLGVERRWPRYRWDGQGLSRWAGWGWSRYLVMVTGGFLLGATFLESAISKGGERAPWPFFGWLAESPAGFLILGILLVLNGWLVDRALSDRTPFEDALPLWLRGLRRALVSVPVFGLYAIPAWRWVIQRRPTWVRRSFRRLPLDLAASHQESRDPCRRSISWIDSRRRIHGQSLPALLLWMILGQIGPWFALLSALMTTPSLSSSRRAVLQGVSFLFHILACACSIQYGILRGGQIRAGRGRRIVLQWAPLSFLFGFLIWIFGFSAWIAAMDEERETLVSRSWARKSSSSPQALRARRASARPTAFSATLQNSEISQTRFAVQRLKLLAFFFDAAALAWLFYRLGKPFFTLQRFPLPELAPCLFLAILGLLIEGVSLAVRIFGWLRLNDRRSLPYGRWITFPQLVLAAGCLFGTLLAMGSLTNVGHLLIVIGMGALLSTTLFASGSFLLDLSNPQTFVTLSWILLFLEVIVVGGLTGAWPELSLPVLTFFKAAMILTPVWGLALFLGLGGALLHPFRPRHIFDRRLPGRLRAALAAVCITAILPLGAIAIPFWIYACHWVWRRYEPLLNEGEA